MKRVIAFLMAVVVAYIVAAVTYTQLNLSNLVDMGLAVPFGVRLSATLHDLVGMSVFYLPTMAIALLVGFGLAALALKWVPQLRTLGYMTGGFVSLLSLILVLGIPFDTHLLAVTRTNTGLVIQCLAGALGGYVFARFLPAPG